MSPGLGVDKSIQSADDLKNHRENIRKLASKVLIKWQSGFFFLAAKNQNSYWKKVTVLSLLLFQFFRCFQYRYLKE